MTSDFFDLSTHGQPPISDLYSDCVSQVFYITEFECDGKKYDYVKLGEKLTMSDGTKYGRITRIPKEQLEWLHQKITKVLSNA